VKAAVGLGVPVVPIEDRNYDLSFLQRCAKPKLFVTGDRDEYGPRAQVEAMVNALPEPKKLMFISAADHFFTGRLREMREVVEEWVREMRIG